MKKNIALIFARGGSKGIPKKNIKKINNVPLIDYTILQAKNSNLIDDIYVSTESDEIAEIAMLHDIKVIKRPQNLATDDSPELESWKHSINYLENLEVPINKIIVLPVTAPLRNLIDINSAIELLNETSDIIISITETNHNPYFNMVQETKEGNYKIAIKNDFNISRRQDVPKIFNMTTVIYVTYPSYIKNTKNLLDGNVQAIKVPSERAIDIDNDFDFEIAEYFLNKKNKI